VQTTPAGRLAIQRVCGGWKITGTDILLYRPPAAGRPWQIYSHLSPIMSWLRQRGGAEFDTLDDALRALHAIHHHDPLPPAKPFSKVRLVKTDKVSVHGHPIYTAPADSRDITVTRVKAGYYEITVRGLERTSHNIAATLNEVADAIAETAHR